jgi:hypothetical protein
VSYYPFPNYKIWDYLNASSLENLRNVSLYFYNDGFLFTQSQNNEIKKRTFKELARIFNELTFICFGERNV